MLHPDWSKNAVIYEVNIRQYTPEGTFSAFSRHLPRLKDMGVKILWLMPVYPIGLENRKGSLGSYYSISDFRGINPEFGTLEDFRALVNKIHRLGMYVLIDWVANHASKDNHLTYEHPEWFAQDENGNVISRVKDWTDVADLNYDNPDLRRYMKESLEYWIKETGVDGYRCDVAGMIPVSFWNESVPELRKLKDIFMLAEWETPDMHDIAFDATYSWDIYKLMNEIAKGAQTPEQIDHVWSENARNFPSDAIRLRFTSNHDENSWNGSEHERMGPAALTFAALSFLIPGMPLIYSGQESGFNRRLSFFDKDQIDWEFYRFSCFYKTLIHLKSANKALWNQPEGGEIKKITTERNDQVYAFSRSSGDDHVAGIFNLSGRDAGFSINHFDIPGKFRDIFSLTFTSIENGVSFSLKPWEFHIYQKQNR